MTGFGQHPGSRVYVCGFSHWQQSVHALLTAADFCAQLRGRETVLLKPNLVEPLAPPITTPVALVAAIIKVIRALCPKVTILVGEGCGSRDLETTEVFAALGYTRMAAELAVELVDLNRLPCRKLRRPACRRWPEIYLPELVLDSFLLSIPQLKAHSLAGVTLTMKNMMGLVPPAHYQRGGHWKKAAFHDRIQEAVFDLNRYRTPDFTIMDATVGMQKAHLWGPTCDPAPNRLACSRDPVAIDAWGAALLGRDWQQIDHIRLADGELGHAGGSEIVLLDQP